MRDRRSRKPIGLRLWVVHHKEDVDNVIELVRKAGRKIVKEPREVFRGGYHAYFSDLDRYYWEVSWGPNFQFDENGLLKF